MDYAAYCIIETEEGLYISDSFIRALLDKVDHLDRARWEAVAKALFQVFNLPARP